MESLEYGPSPDRAVELPWDEKHSVVEEAINKLGGRIRHCFKNAFDHLRRSWQLHPVDSEMSMFRAITAEEEAATALMLAIKQRGYHGSDKLSPYEHSHKAAVSPFVEAIVNLLADTGVPAPQLSINRGRRPMLALAIDLSALTGDETPEFATFDFPLNFVIKVGRAKKAHMFQSELEQLAAGRGASSIQQLVKNEANLRNRLLYASDQGIPSVKFNDSVILRRRDRVYRLALLTIAILQTRQHQLFAVQCLQAFMAVLGKNSENYPPIERMSVPSGFQTVVVQQPDGSYIRNIAFKISSNVQISATWLEENRVSFSKNG